MARSGQSETRVEHVSRMRPLKLMIESSFQYFDRTSRPDSHYMKVLFRKLESFNMMRQDVLHAAFCRFKIYLKRLEARFQWAIIRKDPRFALICVQLYP